MTTSYSICPVCGKYTGMLVGDFPLESICNGHHFPDSGYGGTTLQPYTIHYTYDREEEIIQLLHEILDLLKGMKNG